MHTSQLTYHPSYRPHTSGVRYCPCGSFATNPCRPTACTGIKAKPAPNVHCSLYIVHCWFYTFSAKEKDVETGLSYFGSRYYSSDLSIWLSVDPMSDKYASLSPYVYCADNPVKLVDPNGEEGIVVSGGELDDFRYKYYFIEPAITRLKELKAAGNDESITWCVMTAGYSKKDIEKFQSIAADLGVEFQAIGSADEFTNYLNSKDIGNTSLSDARKNDKITSLTVFGHGKKGSAEFAYGQSDHDLFSWGLEDVKKLEKGAFNNATINLYTCNSATDCENGKSLGYTLAQQTGATVTGYRGQSTYAKMNVGEGFWAKMNRRKNGFNTNGSAHMPQAGNNTIFVNFVH